MSTTTKPAAKIDRLPPHAIEAERGILGCVLLSPVDCMAECHEKIKDAQAFYDLRHRTVYEELSAMREENKPIDLITFQQWLKDKGQLDRVGGVAYLSTLPDGVPSAAHLGYYIEIVKDKYLLRRMIQTCHGVISRAYEYQGEIDELVDSVEKDILSISESRGQTSTPPIKELVQRAINKIEEYHKNQGIVTGIATGFADLDKMTTGLHEGEMIVIAARPSVGKTSLAMNIAEHVAVDQQTPVGVFSLEMTGDQLTLRMLSSQARVNLRNVTGGFLTERDFPKLANAMGKLMNAPLHIDDSSGLSILQLRAKARRMWQQHGIKLFIIDYMQLLNSTNRRTENRQQEIADISGGIKAMAKELNVPVIILSQLNRELEKRVAGEKPRLSDLRESGAIEQDADFVGLLYKPKAVKDEEDSGIGPDSIQVNLLVAKQRNGPTGEVPLTFLKSYTRFENAAKIETRDVPNYDTD